ncbi:MAG: DUF1707 SHOCT-like domain-containing protein [Solirubrobacteraceae bacterium]
MTDHNPWTDTSPNQYPHRPGLRAGDSDRDTVAEYLRDQHVEGRLDTDELQQRIGACYGAKTLDELEYLIADLPRAPSAHEHPGGRVGWWRAPWLWLTPTVATLAVISGLTHRHLIWLAIPLLFAARLARTGHPSWSSWTDHDFPRERGSASRRPLRATLR